MVNILSHVIDGLKGIADGDVTLFDIFQLVFNLLWGVIFQFIKWFFSQTKDFFITVGNDITQLFGSQSFTDYWYLWIIGIFIGIFIIKYIISAVIEFISKILDLT